MISSWWKQDGSSAMEVTSALTDCFRLPPEVTTAHGRKLLRHLSEGSEQE